MINPKELRIGNIISWHTGFGELIIGSVYEVHADKVAIGPETVIDANSSGQSFMKFTGIKAIPLTAEWLERMGFANEPKGSLCYAGAFQICNYNEDGVYVFTYDNRRAQVQYVHQLQNLFFSLTGEELKLKDQ